MIGMPERRSPLYEVHRRLSAEMIKGGGDYMFPLSYTSPVQEHVNTRTNVGMQDLTSMGEIDVKGPGAERLINYLLVNEIRDLDPGRLRYSTMCNEDGGIVDDITVYKFHDEHYMIVTSSGPRKKSFRWIADHAVGTSTYVTDVSGSIALISVQGPRARDFLENAVRDVDVGGLRYFRFTSAVVGETELTISRSGYTGELGFELYVPAEEAVPVWEQLVRSGGDFGLMPYGVAAMQSLRLEKGYPLYGNDINEDYTPFHVGLDRWIKFSKREFVGREALLRVQELGPEERWVGLVLDSAIPAGVRDKVSTIGDVLAVREKIYTGSEAEDYEEDVLPGSEVVGHVTFSARGHTVEKMLAMAYVQSHQAWPGKRLVVEVNGRPRTATVASTPFFDPQGVRIKS
jgi:aminomethyltransferase